MKEILSILLTGETTDYSANIEQLQEALIPFANIAIGKLSDNKKYSLQKEVCIYTFKVNNEMVAQVNFANNLCRLPNTVFELNDEDIAVVALLCQAISEL